MENNMRQGNPMGKRCVLSSRSCKSCAGILNDTFDIKHLRNCLQNWSFQVPVRSMQRFLSA